MSDLKNYSLSSSRGAVHGKWMVNPLIVLNMGSEMVYILEQRLKAQQIAADKACRVLVDTVSALLELEMVESTFSAQPTFSSSSVRALFHRITHCSIMRLNDESMDKLYDLMMMGLKVQLIRCRDSYELIESTLHRLDHIHSIIDSKCASSPEHENLLSVIHSVRQRVIRTYFGSISTSKLLVVRKRLFQWVQDRKIKVSILLQKKLQSLDGHIITNSVGMLPKFTQIPGRQYRITLQDIKQNNVRLDEHSLILPNSKCCYPSNIRYSLQCHRLHTQIGQNLYCHDESHRGPQRAMDSADGSGHSSHGNAPSARSTPKHRAEISKALKTQLNGLSSIVNEVDTQSATATTQRVLKLDLFHFEIDDVVDENGQTQSQQNDQKGTGSQMRFGRRHSALKDALQNLNLSDRDGSSDIKTEDETVEEDLFDLLDGDDDDDHDGGQ